MLQKLRQCFAPEPVNTGRQVELDIAKGLAIFSMIVCHVFMQLSDWSSPLQTLLFYDMLGGPFAAPVFMICMGISIEFSRHQQPKYFFFRGCRLLILAFVLDIIRYTLPTYLDMLAEGNPSWKNALAYSFGIDILQFSAVFFVFFSVVRHYRLKTGFCLLIAAALSAAGWALNGMPLPNKYATMAAGFLWRSADYSYFPFFNWCIFPVIGYLFAGKYKYCCDKQRLYRTVLSISLPFSIIYLLWIAVYGYTSEAYYGMGIVHAFFATTLVFSILSVCHLLLKEIQIITRCLSWMSKHLTAIYCAHWIIIMYIPFIVPFQSTLLPLSPSLVLPATLMVTAASCLACVLLRKVTEFIRSHVRIPHHFLGNSGL